MQTRSSSKFVSESSSNPISTNLKRRNRIRSKSRVERFSIPTVMMADNRTMKEILQAPTEGYVDAIVVKTVNEDVQIQALIDGKKIIVTEASIRRDLQLQDAEEKRIQKIDRLARSLLIQGLPNDIYSIIDSNKTAKDLWDALARHMFGSEYDEQDRKAAVLYKYETFKATEGELLLNTCIRYLQVINDLKKCGYSKDNCELNFKFLKNLQPEWKQYATMMRQNKNLMDINIDALYNILKQNQGDVNDAM
nr:hypothetical protein [Tanacetum cinerariifolium]